MIAVIDYGSSNIRSVALAVRDVSREEVELTSDPRMLLKATRLILPGVCSYPACMKGLKQFALIDVIKEQVIEKKKPILGICIGMQVFSTVGYEYGETEGLGFIPGVVERLTTKRVPHMGWNKCRQGKQSIVFSDDEQYYYFANSFHFLPDDQSVVCLRTCLETEMVAAVERENVFGCQFHPERSGEAGLEVLRKFSLC